jgi:hypothetical protein
MQYDETYKAFYENPIIQRLADNEQWTLSNPDKKPLDVTEYLLTKDTATPHIWGASFDRGHNPYVKLDVILQEFPTAWNHAYALNYLIDDIVVMDIEKTCPEAIKEQFLKLPYLYAETSMSGQGLHLIFETPKCLTNYPIAAKKQKLQEKHGYYEIMLNHMITFTRNVLPEREPELGLDVFENIVENLAVDAKETAEKAKLAEMQMDFDPTNIFNYKQIMEGAGRYVYTKTPENFDNDMNRYEYGFIGGYYRQIVKLIENLSTCKGHEYTSTEIIWLTYSAVKEHIEYRAKHDETRNNMPWLLYLCEDLIAKEVLKSQENKK